MILHKGHLEYETEYSTGVGFCGSLRNATVSIIAARVKNVNGRRVVRYGLFGEKEKIKAVAKSERLFAARAAD